MMGFSNLQWFGIAASVVIAVLAMMQLLRQRDMIAVVLGLLVAGALLLVSLDPEIVTPFASWLKLQSIPGGRLIVTLMVSVLLLFLAVGVERQRRIGLGAKLNELVEHLALTRTGEAPPELSGAVVVLVPVFNERENLGNLLPSMPSAVHGVRVEIVVIDDGSSDDPDAVVRGSGAYLLQHPIRLGGGAALRTGFALARRFEPRCVVTMDGDGQHRPEDLAVMSEPVLAGTADFVIGSRVLGESRQHSAHRRAGVVLYSVLISLLTGRRITDCSSGYRAFSMRFVRDAHLLENQYHTVEAIYEARRLGLRIVERPVTVLERLTGSTKKGSEMSYAADFSYALLKNWARRRSGKS